MNTRISRQLVLWVFIILAMVTALTLLPGGNNGEEVGYHQFLADVKANSVKEVVLDGQDIRYETVSGEIRTTIAPLPEAQQPLFNLLDEYNVQQFNRRLGDDSLVWNILFSLLPIVLMVGVFVWFMRQVQGTNGRAMNFGKSRAKLNVEGRTRVSFEDVAGIDEVKDELGEVVDFLKDPRKFTRLGGRIPKGVLLMGSPGTGKTLLAKAVAGEAGVPFFSISGSDFVEMFVGVGASRVRDLFEQAKKQAPCIVFIDEIDAVGRQRGAGLGGGHDEREQTLNQLLVEMDGFEGTEGVIVIAATNRPDVLDPALLRPGRFDRRVMVPNPDVKGRQRILQIHTRRIPLGGDVDLAILAKGTPGFSGADLENLCNEAALGAARDNKKQVDMADFIGAREKVVMGPERRSLTMPEEERRNTAYHEAGHAIIAHLLPGHDPVHKISIVPRGRALGVTWTLPSEDKLSRTREDMYKQLSMMMGGRAAEEVALNSVTGGASNDILRATRMARQMVCNLGMSDELGPVSWSDGDDEPFLGRSMAAPKAYSEDTARRIDDEVKAILERAYESARMILTHNIHILHRVAQSLIERESLDSEEFAEIVSASGPVAPKGLSWMGV